MAPSPRQQEQRRLAWVYYVTLGAQENLHNAHAQLCQVTEAGHPLRAALQEAIVALNAAAELAQTELLLMKGGRRG